MSKARHNIPLIQALMVKDMKEVRRLVASGADVNVRDRNGATPLHFAACGMPEMITFLCENGAHPTAKDIQGYSPLHVAYLRKDVESIRLLAAHGADIHDPIPGMKSPVEEARACGNWIVLEALGAEGTKERSPVDEDCP
jgi:ankyrin repeat protein